MVAAASFVVSGVSISPPGASSIHGLLELVPDVDRLVVARQAELRVAGEVDEHAEHREHLVVLGPRRAQRQRARLLAGNRRVRLVHRLDHASADTTVLVDVVDEDLGGLLLVAAREVHEVCDRGVVDDRDPDLDRVCRHAVPEIAAATALAPVVGVVVAGTAVVVVVIAAARREHQRCRERGRRTSGAMGRPGAADDGWRP